MTYGLITLMIVTLMFVVAVGYDFYNNIKFRNRMTLKAYGDIISTLLALTPDFKTKYKNLYRVVSSFEGVDLENVIFNNPQEIHSVPKQKINPLKKEMEKIIANRQENEMLILEWYLNINAVINRVESRKTGMQKDLMIDPLDNRSVPNVSKSDVKDFSNGVCFA